MLSTYKTYLSQKTQLTPDVYLFRFSLDEPKELNFIAGQYMILLIPQEKVVHTTLMRPHSTRIDEERDNQVIRRLYSITSSSFEKKFFELLVKIIPGGVGSTYLANLKIGDEVLFQGPAGMFTLRKSPRDKIFLATGTGIAPILSMIKSQIQNPKSQINHKSKTQNSKRLEHLNLKNSNLFGAWNLEFRILLFWGLPHLSDVYFLDELKNLKFKIKNFDFHICLSREQSLEAIPKEDRWYFVLGHVNDGLDRLISNFKFQISNFDYYLCGSRQVVDSLRQYLAGKGIPKEQVFFEKF